MSFSSSIDQADRGQPGRRYAISELAKEFEVTPRAIRHYEDEGLLAPERKGQTRIYHNRDRTRLKLILRGRRLGFSLNEIKEFLDLYDADPTEITQLKYFLFKIGERRRMLLRQRDDIEATLSELDQIENHCSDVLQVKEAEAGSQPCRIAKSSGKDFVREENSLSMM